MKALLLYENNQNTEPGLPTLKYAENACHSMGIKTVAHYSVSAVSPTLTDLDNMVIAEDIDLVIIPRWTGTSDQNYNQFVQGTMSVPVFILGVNNISLVTGVSTYSADAYQEAEIVSTGGTIYTNSGQVTLSSETLPAASTAIVRGTGADSAKVTEWKYTPDGETFVYWSASGSQYSLLHLLIQEAVNDGVLANTPKRAPIFLNIDHVNDGGDSPFDGGFQEQPNRLALIGEILRGQNGVCYASPEKAWINNDAGGLGGGTVTGDLLANLQSYSDVFKYIACHDHNQFYTAGTGVNDAIDNQTSKAAIDASYQATKTAIEGLGLTVNIDFAHCSGNRLGSNFLELAQATTGYLSDPLNITPKAGYGFKAVRISGGGTANESYPHIATNGTATITPCTHWMGQKTVVRDILCVPSKDGGSANGAISAPSLDYLAFSQNIFQLLTGVLSYHHGADFEDASIRSGSVSTDGSAMTRGVLSWQTGAAYAAACPNTVNFGADINDYIRTPVS